jgi:hypothetical protein
MSSENHFQTFALMLDGKEVGYISRNLVGEMLLNLNCYHEQIRSFNICKIINVDDFVCSVIHMKKSSKEYQDMVIKCYDDLFVHFKNSFDTTLPCPSTYIRVYHQVIGLVCTCVVDDVVDVTDKVYL